jgi:tRNA (adenine37-N6)-methyltransferase
MEFHYSPIGFLRTSYKTTDSIPKQFGIAPTSEGIVEVLEEYGDGLLHIEAFSHLILIFAFHQSRQKPLKVIPPTQEKERGVFASRSPHRPNALGILTVRFKKRDGNRLFVEGVDLLDGTPILDIKPYLLHFDCRPEATAAI